VLSKVRVPGPVGRPRTRPDAVAGDKAYSSHGNRAHLRRRGIKAVIPEKRDQAANRKRKGRKGGRPVDYDAELYGVDSQRQLHARTSGFRWPAAARGVGIVRHRRRAGPRAQVRAAVRQAKAAMMTATRT
jgi:IS5 family transposase